MSDLLLKKEHLPKRCEICHQNDIFDPVTQKCGRCETLFSSEKKTKADYELIKVNSTSTFQKMLKKQLVANPITQTTVLSNPVLGKILKFFELENIYPNKEENLIPLIKAEYKYQIKRYLVFMLMPIIILSIVSLFTSTALFGVVFFLVIFFMETIFISTKWYFMLRKAIKGQPINMMVMLKKELDSDGDSTFYLQLYQGDKTNNFVEQLKVIRPSWPYQSTINQPLTARVFRLSRKKAIIHTNFGILIAF